MRKMKVVCLATLLTLLSFCCNPIGTQFGYEEQICPLSNHNIEIAEDLLEIVQEKLTEANKEGIYTTEVEIAVAQGHEFLQKAKMFYQKGHSCITANNFAFKSINVFEKSIEVLESKSRATKDEEYAVYKAFVDEGFYLIGSNYDEDEIQLFVIIDHTTGCEADDVLSEELEWVGEEIPSAEQETLDNFQLKNAVPHSLEDYFDFPAKVVLVDIEEIKEIFQEGSGWEGFYAKYPFSEGIMTLSRVGFNAEMNQALLYVTGEWSDSIGSGYYVLFEKKNGIWTIQDWVRSWIY
jgi:hypothetical protein